MVAARPLSERTERWTPEAYLAFEDAAATKHEFMDGHIVAMSGGSPSHALITMSTGAHLYAQLRGGNCFLFTSDLRVQSDSAAYFYPDLSLVCGEPRYDKNDLLNPTVIIEVLSPSTELYDRVAKFGHYRTLASLQHYVLIAQDHAHIEVYTRQAKGAWLFTEAVGLDAVIALEHIGCTLALSEVYAQITFDESTL